MWESWRSCTWFMRSTIIFCITTYRLLGEPGAAGLRAPPQSVGNPQPDLDNASEGKASKERNSGECTPSPRGRSPHPGKGLRPLHSLALAQWRLSMPFDTIPTIAGTGKQRLSERLREGVLPLWQRQLEHPFVVALGNGSLPLANFEFFIRQDALFLDELTKTFAYAATRTSDHDEMEQFGKFLLNTLLVEAELHRRYGERFGLTAGEMAATRMAPTNYAYTRHLLFIA